MKCPTCKETNLVMSERQGIEIDYCPDCRGIWLDRGELDKIIEKTVQMESNSGTSSQQQQQQQVPPQQGFQTHQVIIDPYHSHKHYKKKKHWLHELFD